MKKYLFWRWKWRFYDLCKWFNKHFDAKYKHVIKTSLILLKWHKWKLNEVVDQIEKRFLKWIVLIESFLKDGLRKM